MQSAQVAAMQLVAHGTCMIHGQAVDACFAMHVIESFVGFMQAGVAKTQPSTAPILSVVNNASLSRVLAQFGTVLWHDMLMYST